MGSISLQSTQVTAKNSIKIKSLCLGIKFEVAVGEETARDETTTGITVEGIVVAEIFSCGVIQENKSRELINTNK